MSIPLLIAIGLILVGLTLLVLGGELMVRGASKLAGILNISPLIIGLTVVAFGTSAPELAVTLQASFSGSTDLAIGNVVGSNIANVLLILGLSAAIVPLVISSRLVRLDVPLMVGASVAMLLLGLDGSIDRLDGCFMFGSLVIYIVWSIYQCRRESKEVKQEFADEYPSVKSPSTTVIAVQIGLIIAGLVLLGVGSNWLVSGATSIARSLGVSELMIGLTIIAIGTSLPEVVTSTVAALRGEREIAAGNVVGSNLFNILAVLGLGSIFAPEGIPVSQAALQFDIPIMIAVAVACLPIFFTGQMIARWEGGLFIFYYVAYTTYLILAATNASITRSFEIVMFGFVVPLTVITLLISFWQAIHVQRDQKDE